MERNQPTRRRRTRNENKSVDLTQNTTDNLFLQNDLNQKTSPEIKNEDEITPSGLENRQKRNIRSRRRTQGDVEILNSPQKQENKSVFNKPNFYNDQQIISFIQPCKELLDIYNFLANSQKDFGLRNENDHLKRRRRRNVDDESASPPSSPTQYNYLKYNIMDIQEIIKENQQKKKKEIFHFMIGFDETRLLENLRTCSSNDINSSAISEFFKNYPLAFLAIVKTKTFQKIPSDEIIEILSSFPKETQNLFFEFLSVDIQMLIMISENLCNPNEENFINKELIDFVFNGCEIEKANLNNQGQIVFMSKIIENPSIFHNVLNDKSPLLFLTSNEDCFDPSSPKVCFLYPITSTFLIVFLNESSFSKSQLLNATILSELSYYSFSNVQIDENEPQTPRTPVKIQPPEVAPSSAYFRKKNHHNTSPPSVDLTSQDDVMRKTKDNDDDSDSSLYLPPDKVTIPSKSYYDNEITNSPLRERNGESNFAPDETEDDVPIANYLSYIFMRTKAYTLRGKRIHYQLYLDDRPLFHSKILNDHPQVIFFNQGTDCHITGEHFGKILVNPNIGTFTLRLPDDPDVDRCVIRFYHSNAAGVKRVISFIFLPNSPPKVPLKLKSASATMSANGQWEFHNYHKHSIESVKNGTLTDPDTNKMYMSISKISKKEAEVIAHPNIPPENVFLFAISSFVAKGNKAK